MREQFDEIYNSITNGQRKQAYAQMLELSAYDRATMLDYFCNELNNPALAVDAVKTFFRLSVN